MSIHLQLNLMMLNGNQSMRKTPTSVRKFEDLAVSKGFSQRAGIDFKRRFHPLSDMILGICCRCKARYERLSNGIVCAYLNATVKVVVYMKQP